MTTETLKKQYLDPSQPGSFSGLGTFFRALKADGLDPKRKEVQTWLQSQDAYTLHKALKRKYPRNKVIVAGIDDTWQADLVDMQKFSRINSGYKYIITCIDVFSKYAWAIPLKNKTAKETVRGFDEIFKSGRIPKRLHCDEGTEFMNKKLELLLKSKNIKLYNVNSELKASVVERFNRTLKEKMFRFFTHNNSYKYANVLGQFLDAYNKTYHRTIKTAPVNVTKENEQKIWKIMYETEEEAMIKYKFNVGDQVRISKYKRVFEKGYTPNWTEEVFIITERLPRVPPVYKLKDLNQEVLKGVFYESELQKILKQDQIFKVSKILSSRKKNGQLEHKIRWLGYNKDFDSWVPASEIIRKKK